MAHFAKGGKVLDLGCGNGILAKYIRALTNVEIVGVDYSRQAIDQGIQRGIPNCEFVCDDLRTFHPAQAYSMIIFNESLYYVSDCVAVLKRYRRYLQPDGFYVISMFRTPLTMRAWRKLKHPGDKILHDSCIEDGRTRHQWLVRVVSPPRQKEEELV